MLRALGIAGLLTFLSVADASHALSYAAGGLPSCYAANDVKPLGPLYDRTFVVLIDQTLQLDDNLRNQVLHSVDQLIAPGTHVIVGEFSAFSQGRYLNLAEDVVVEAPISEDRLGELVATAVEPFKRCMADQLAYARRSTEEVALSIIQNSTSSLDQSDIMMALKDVSAPVMSDHAQSKVVLVVTDGLENSDVTSFYSHRTARDVSPEIEMQKARGNGMLGNFAGAKVYVIGGAMVPPATHGSSSERDGYRNPKMLVHLAEFWKRYFEASNAVLEEFGTPALLSPVAY